ncbi:preprotein translocase subunit SecA [Paraburkholderia sp. UCT31]|uniref:preprotein translocase subunit SecA n=1 Tax=Paraburkholderia sp. UCT31 TaxID=2615209 RepID=UPI0016560FB5|nr:preprotein translocase subunit SecA [Paraburkholderia sp. UCT31]MBC8737304.1 preprotein translocase subunit SecA [Paraburkholderia sp. UCT31]
MLNTKIHGWLSRRALQSVSSLASAASRHDAAVTALDDEALKARYHALGTLTKKNFPEALAIVRAAAERTLGLRAFDVQLMGAAALFDGVIAEMKTGEGKTLTIALAAALAALEKDGVHVATVNPYLAARDAESLRPFFEFLGLSVGVTLPGQSTEEKQAAYQADVTYGVHSEIGFDYLRDNMVSRWEYRVQRPLNFVIVDEADSILIDEARTPLIISQPIAQGTDLYHLADGIAASLRAHKHFEVDEKLRSATFTEAGLEEIESQLIQRRVIADKGALFQSANLYLMRYLQAALRAHVLYKRDRDYIVRDGAVHIVDEATGRVLEGRQWQEGLHQAVEAKEGVEIKPETETAAEITYQSLFRLYRRLSGLTGTALTAADEFEGMYDLQVVRIPTNRPVKRRDHPDLLFRSKSDKFAAIVADIKARSAGGQPVLVGTASVSESEEIAVELVRAGIHHRVLNARQNEQEAEIIADAGLPGAVTVATNMAGRGTDIVLGGHTDKDDAWRERHARVIAAGGLHVLGTQRHESRRVDDQLRGRAGRQGDPGSSQFYLCLDDELLRVFGSDRMAKLLNFAGVGSQSVSGGILDRAVSKAQARIEGRHFDSRKNIAKFDGVMAAQRDAVYANRQQLLLREVSEDFCFAVIGETALMLAQTLAPDDQLPEMWDLKALKGGIERELGPELPLIRWVTVDELDATEVHERIVEGCVEYYRTRREAEEGLSEREQSILLQVLDQFWRGHLTHLDELRESIHLRQYASQDPVVAFRKEAFNAFQSFQRRFWAAAASALTLAFRAPPEQPSAPPVIVVGPDESNEARQPEGQPLQRRISRNEPCPCGSGERYKNCHGKLA